MYYSHVILPSLKFNINTYCILYTDPSVPPSLQRHSAAHLMHNPNTQTQNMQMPDPRLHHNMQNDPRQSGAHSIQSIDPRSGGGNLQNNRPTDNTMQSMDPRMTGLNNSQSTTNSNEQRDQIGQKRDRSSDMVSMVPPNKLSISEKMMSPTAHCNTCNCHLQNDSFPMREQGISILNYFVSKDI